MPMKHVLSDKWNALLCIYHAVVKTPAEVEIVMSLCGSVDVYIQSHSHTYLLIITLLLDIIKINPLILILSSFMTFPWGKKIPNLYLVTLPPSLPPPLSLSSSLSLSLYCPHQPKIITLKRDSLLNLWHYFTATEQYMALCIQTIPILNYSSTAPLGRLLHQQARRTHTCMYSVCTMNTSPQRETQCTHCCQAIRCRDTHIRMCLYEHIYSSHVWAHIVAARGFNIIPLQKIQLNT